MLEFAPHKIYLTRIKDVEVGGKKNTLWDSNLCFLGNNQKWSKFTTKVVNTKIGF